jgi:hypothetical protein
MISRFNLLPHRHFIYRFLIETLFDSYFGKDQSICSHMIKPCDIQEQLFVAQFALHPQLMSSINASYAGCWSIQLTDNIFCDIFCHSKTASSLMWKISYVLFTLSCQLVKLMRNDSFCFVNKKTPSVISYHLQKTLCKNAYWDQIARQQFGNAPVSRCSVYHQQKKHGWVIEKTYVVRWLDEPAACIWGIDAAH